MSQPDARPLAAIGHLFLRTSDVPAAAQRLESVGLRVIVAKESLAVLELRGGTHIVLRPSTEAGGSEVAEFDLMFDDLDAAHSVFAAQGFTVSAIETGRIHRSFEATAPEDFTLQVVDSHAGQRVV